MNGVISWLKNREHQLLVIILALAAFTRLYRISDYMTFLGDEGRDVLIVRQILQGDFTLLGPRSSAADFFYGPIYYYLITPFLWLFRFDPVGPAVFIAILGIITVYLIYRFGKVWFGGKGALIAALLYSISPVVINYSHSSWNPNPLPLVALVALYALYKGVASSRRKYFLGVGILLGVAIQLQYLALFLAIIIGFYTLVATWMQEKKQKLFRVVERYVLLLAGFIIGWSPFLAFEVLHGFPNLKTISNFLLGKYSSGQPSTATFFGQVHETFFKLFGRLVMHFPNMHPNQALEKPETTVWYVGTILLGLISVLAVFKVKNSLARWLLLSWIVLGILLFGFYKKSIYDYYLGFMFPLPFLLIGNLSEYVFSLSKKTIFKVSLGLVLLGLFALNISGIPFRYEPNRQKNQVKTIAEFIISKTDNKPYNFALITPGNSDHAYRYYLDILGRKPVEIENPALDPERLTVTDQLLIVCEDIHCGPLGHPLFDVAAFGRAEIAGEWDVSVVKVFKLIPYKSEDADN